MKMLLFPMLAILTLSSAVAQGNNNTDLEQRVEILEVEVEFLTDEVEEIEVDVNQLDDQMTAVEDTVIGNTDDIADLTNSVEDTEDTMAVLVARMEALEAANNLLQQTVDVLQQTVDVLNNTVIALQNTDNTTNDRLQEVETDLQDTIIKLADVDEEVQTHDIDTGYLDEAMTTLQVSMSNLEDTVDSVEDDMTTLNVENDEIQQRLTLLEETVIVPWVACASSPCSNGGSCIDVNVDTFTCSCRDGYFGTNCEQSYYETPFLATFSASTVTPTDPIVFDVTKLNPGGHYDNTTGIYTVPLDGIYQVSFHIWGYNDEDIEPHLVIDGTRVIRGRSLEGDYEDPRVDITVLISLTAGQEVWVDNYDTSGLSGVSETYMWSWFSAHLIHAY